MLKRIFFVAFIVAISILALWRLGNAFRFPFFTTEDKPARGLVLPHHDLAREIIVSALAQIAGQSVSRIVVLSPNHFRPQSYTFTSTESLKSFPIDVKTIRLLRQSDPELVLDSKLLDGEHGLFVPMTYLAHQFPRAQFIPLAVSPYFDPDNLQRMADHLMSVLPPDTLFVASVDFSHEHMSFEAARFNAQTIAAISGFDYASLYRFTDDNLDSPAAVAVLLRIMEKNGAVNWETWYDSHGAVLTDTPTLQGTSYVIGAFR